MPKVKKTKKQIAIEKRIKELKTQHGTLSKQKITIEKRLDRENKIVSKKVAVLEKQVERLQTKIDDLENDDLPSEKKKRKIVDKLVALEDRIRSQERVLRDLTEPPPSDAKRAHEVGEEE